MKLSQQLVARLKRRTTSVPRLTIGILVVAASILVGARLTAPDTSIVPAVSASADLAAGTVLRESDVERTRIDQRVSAQYVTEPSEIAGKVLAAPVGDGELIRLADLGPPPTGDDRLVTLTVEEDRLPAAVTRGSVVDVFAAIEAAGDEPQIRLVASAVVVEEVAGRSGGFADSGSRAVTFRLAGSAASEFVAGTQAGDVVLAIVADRTAATGSAP